MLEQLALVVLTTGLPFVVLYRLSQPLNNNQTQKIAQKRRRRKLEYYFSYNSSGSLPSESLKIGLSPSGQLYQINVSLRDSPSFVANLLKGKKHEWSVIVFGQHQTMTLLWANKGMNNRQVTVLATNRVLDIAIKNRCDIILAFHNHPASDPQHYSYSRPSQTDLKSSQELSQSLYFANISYADYVCERGLPHRYYVTPSETLYSITEIASQVQTENSKGRINRLRLFFELML